MIIIVLGFVLGLVLGASIATRKVDCSCSDCRRLRWFLGEDDA